MADYTNLDPRTFVAPPRAASYQTRGIIVGAIGAVVCLIGLFVPGGPEHLLRSWLTAFMFWVGLAAGCMGVLMLTYMVGGWWGFIPRRIFLSGAQNVYLMALFFLPVLIFPHKVYEWMTPEFRSALAPDKAHLWKFESYLTQSRWTLWSILYFLIRM